MSKSKMIGIFACLLIAAGLTQGCISKGKGQAEWDIETKQGVEGAPNKPTTPQVVPTEDVVVDKKNN